MTEEVKYLTDEELEKMMEAIEKEDLVMAPPELLSDVLKKIETKDTKLPKSDFMLYSIRVIAAMAASLVLLFVIPDSVPLPDRKSPQRNIPAKEEIVEHGNVKSKEEVLNSGGISSAAKILKSFVNYNRNE